MYTIIKKEPCSMCYGLGTTIGSKGEEVCEECGGYLEIENEVSLMYAPWSVMAAIDSRGHSLH